MAGSQGNRASGEELELAKIIVSALNLDVLPEEIDPEAPLYGEGLGLDSIDMLEIALVVSRNYGLQLRSDDDGNRRIFSSLQSLSQHIQAHRTK
jgi:acyl carrier protein